MDTVMGVMGGVTSSMMGFLASALRMFSATLTAACPSVRGKITANSSPP